MGLHPIFPQKTYATGRRLKGQIHELWKNHYNHRSAGTRKKHGVGHRCQGIQYGKIRAHVHR